MSAIGPRRQSIARARPAAVGHRLRLRLNATSCCVVEGVIFAHQDSRKTKEIEINVAVWCFSSLIHVPALLSGSLSRTRTVTFAKAGESVELLVKVSMIMHRDPVKREKCVTFGKALESIPERTEKVEKTTIGGSSQKWRGSIVKRSLAIVKYRKANISTKETPERMRGAVFGSPTILPRKQTRWRDQGHEKEKNQVKERKIVHNSRMSRQNHHPKATNGWAGIVGTSFYSAPPVRAGSTFNCGEKIETTTTTAASAPTVCIVLALLRALSYRDSGFAPDRLASFALRQGISFYIILKPTPSIAFEDAALMQSQNEVPVSDPCKLSTLPTDVLSTHLAHDAVDAPRQRIHAVCYMYFSSPLPHTSVFSDRPSALSGVSERVARARTDIPLNAPPASIADDSVAQLDGHKTPWGRRSFIRVSYSYFKAA
ncbi:hypothetical protein C8J57DRAFT_1668596 [Mycena rebaudengoi]|nr:hypothetical protein C8J57DRAFT_1668596 [Mycena rebaudengoi]